MVTKFLPLPSNSGGKQRSLAILSRLAARGPVTLCAFDDGAADHDGLRAMGVEVRTVPWRPTPAAALRGLPPTRSLSSARFWDPRLAAEVRSAAADPPDLLQVEYQQLAPYGRGVRAGVRALDLHNVESQLTAGYAASQGGVRGLPFRLEAAALRRAEADIAGRWDLVTVVSEADRKRLGPAGRNALVCPNGWPDSDPLPPADGPVAAFVATLGWRPNADAARWLVGDVWPRVRRALPQARLLLVGRDPGEDLRALDGTDGITVTGTVRDVGEYLRTARVALAPLLAGGGSRLKVLEGLSAGRPVLATTVGASGLEDLVGDGVVVADGPEAFAGTLVELLGDPARCGDLGALGHDTVAKRYSWDGCLAPLLDRLPG